MGDTTRNIAFLNNDVDGYGYKNKVQTSRTWDWQMDIHGRKAIDNLLNNPESVVVKGCRLLKFDAMLRNIVQSDPKNLEKLKDISIKFVSTPVPAGKPTYLEAMIPRKDAPPRPPVAPMTKMNYKVWKIDILFKDKKWFFKKRFVFGIAGLVVVLLLLGWFVFVRVRLPVSQRLVLNEFVFYLAVAQCVHFAVSMVVGFCDGRTVTQGCQIVILLRFVTDANILLALCLPLSIMAIVYGLQSDSLRAGFMTLFHIVGTMIVYITAPRGTHRMLWKAWDFYLVALVAICYFLLFVFTPRSSQVPEEEDKPEEEKAVEA